LLGELCDDLAASHQITVIAGPPDEARPRGLRLLQRERCGRVEIIRTRGTRLPKVYLTARLLNLATYFALAAAAALRIQRPDLIVAETDPPLLGALGALLKRRWGCPLVYNVRDLYPDIAQVTGGIRSRTLLAILRRANRVAFAHSDLIITLSADMRRRIVAKGVPAEKVVIVTDWADTTLIQPIAERPKRTCGDGRFLVMYAGNLGLAQDLDTVLDAAARLRWEPQVRFEIVGDGVRRPELEARARELALSNVEFVRYRARERLAESLGSADLHLLPLKRGTAGCVMPSKMYAILAAGRPFIAMVEAETEIARLVSEDAVGFAVAPGDADALARMIASAARDRARLSEMGVRARALAERRFSRAAVTAQFASAISWLVPSEIECESEKLAALAVAGLPRESADPL
jgi:colanic acid biosynthesis glycosyl transferase WcaI